jgi:fermentation-respiration switch protein FrsA (DUF1100 family)
MLGAVVGIAAGVYLGLLLMLTALQTRLIYFPSREIEATPEQAGLAYEEVFFPAADGVRLHGWFVPAPGARGTVLFFHGNAGNLSHRLASLQTFHQLGYSTFIVSYRGYGRSTGRPSEAGTYRDAEGAWRWLVEQRGIATEQIVIFGRSLGGAVATWLAVQQTPRALILESTFTSVPDLGAELFPFLPVRLIARVHYDTRALLPRVQSPVLIVHSPQDDIIPYHHGRRLWDAAPEPKEFLEITGTHNEGFVTSGRRYVEGLEGFLRSYGPDTAGAGR